MSTAELIRDPACAASLTFISGSFMGKQIWVRRGATVARAIVPKEARESESRSTTTTRNSLSSLAMAGIRDISGIIQQLLALRREEEEDDYGVLRPTDLAFEDAVELLINTAIELHIHLDRRVPRGCASTDSKGGIRIEWVRGNGSVHLAIPGIVDPTKKYIYHKDATGSGVDHSVTPKTLASWLAVICD